MHSTGGHLLLSLGKTLAQIAAELAPVPGLYPMVEVLTGIIELCEKVKQNRHAAHQLCDRCHALVLSIRDQSSENLGVPIIKAKDAVHDCLVDIQTRMKGWAQLGRTQSFLKQHEVAISIEECHCKITDCITRFQLTSQFEIHEWQKEFSENVKHDHDELMRSLAEIKTGQELTNSTLESQTEMIKEMMGLMQTMMGQNKQEAERVHAGISSNLFELQKLSGELLPDFHLKSGEVKRVGEYAIRGSATMDVYEGLFLGKQKVTIKMIRAVNADENSLRRFQREVKIWSEVWRRDRGEHILPFYGYCQTEGPFPYMVSPWQENGDVVTYVKQHDSTINYIELIKHIAMGIRVLHTMEPPIIHGDLRGSNILISDEGKPLISDFGLSQIIHDVSGIPFTQSSGVAESYRFFAPEIILGNGILSTTTDIYALAMTILEIFTHQQPYSRIKHHPEAVLQASRGKQPERPMDARVLVRGLNSDLWRMMTKCWSLAPEERPTIQDVLFVIGLCEAAPER
ncbi:kinase-like domain-containing protein [Cyathus striatus]|nr:kinase-like domain-containing protein [Cyathus striatus]